MTEEIFEIRDFTTVSSFERLVRQLELTIQKWDLPSLKRKYLQITGNSETPLVITEQFSTDNTVYELSYIVSPESVDRRRRNKQSHTVDSSQTNDNKEEGQEASDEDFGHSVSTDPSVCFPPRCRKQQRYFGVDEYVCIEQISVNASSLDLLSALSLASPHMPCFVCSSAPTGQQLFTGTLLCPSSGAAGCPPGRLISYVMDFVSTFSCLNLRSLAELFSAKSQVPLTLMQPHLSNAVQFTYLLDSLAEPPSNEQPQGEDVLELSTCTVSAVTCAHLSVVWPLFPHLSLTDCSLYSDLQSTAAPVWSLRLVMPPAQKLFCAVADRLRRTATMVAEARQLHNKEAVREWLKREIPPGNVPTEEELAVWAGDCFTTTDTTESDDNGEDGTDESAVGSLKGCPHSSLLCALVDMCVVVGSFRGFVMLWEKSVQTLRYCWDSNTAIPNMMEDRMDGPMSQPYWGHCVLHQKLHALNTCIHEKNRRNNTKSENGVDGRGRRKAEWRRMVGEGGEWKLPKPTHKEEKLDGKKPDTVVLEPILPLVPPYTEDDVEIMRETLNCYATAEEKQQVLYQPLLYMLRQFQEANETASYEIFQQWWQHHFGPSQHLLSVLSQILHPAVPRQRCWDMATVLPIGDNREWMLSPDLMGEMALHYIENISGTEFMEQLLTCQVQHSLREMILWSKALNCTVVQEKVALLLTAVDVMVKTCGRSEGKFGKGFKMDRLWDGHTTTVRVEMWNVINQIEDLESLLQRAELLQHNLGHLGLVGRLLKHSGDQEAPTPLVLTVEERKAVARVAAQLCSQRNQECERPLDLNCKGEGQQLPWPPYASEYVLYFDGGGNDIAEHDGGSGILFPHRMYVCVQPEHSVFAYCLSDSIS
eukprot:GHVS01102841.1.p1 GENE.GHVS01102841.1~~GHVS01102841.1.p1  ORF type:complete len:874 (+),score=128.72 GHVS01102841.1:74-2695(+)